MASIKKLRSGTTPDKADSNPTLPDVNLVWNFQNEAIQGSSNFTNANHSQVRSGIKKAV